MLPADRPASGSEHGRQLLGRLPADPELRDADRQAGGVLDAEVLDIDARITGRLEEPGQLPRPVRDDHLHDGQVRRRAAALARDPADTGAAAREQLAELLAGHVLAGRVAPG